MTRLIFALLFFISLPVYAQFDASSYCTARVQLDGRVATSLKDSGGVTADDTDPVATWEDQSGNSSHATQTSATDRPILDIDGFNGHPTLLGSNDDHLEFTDRSLLRNVSGFTMAWVLDYKVKSGVQGLFQVTRSGGGRKVYVYIADDDRISIILQNPDGTANEFYNVYTLTDATQYSLVLAVNFAGQDLRLIANGTQVYSSTSFSGTANTSDSNSDEDGSIMATDMYGGNPATYNLSHFLLCHSFVSDRTGLSNALTTYYDDAPPPSSGGSSAMLMGVGQ